MRKRDDSERYRYYHERGWSSAAQLEAMDAEGIDVAILYPTRGLNVLCEPNMDPPLAAALARAYNNWLYDFCQADPQPADRRRDDLAVRHRPTRSPKRDAA